MPRAGGEADKLGNRYEAIWTVDTLLDLLAVEIRGNPVEIRCREIRCQFIILAREIRCREIRCQFIILARRDEPTPDYARHRITRKDELTPDYAARIQSARAVLSSRDTICNSRGTGGFE